MCRGDECEIFGIREFITIYVKGGEKHKTLWVLIGESLCAGRRSHRKFTGGDEYHGAI